MKKIILTLVLSFSFLFSFGNEYENKNNDNEYDYFNCWVEVTYLTTNPETFETTSFTWYHWVGFASSQESCNKQAEEFANSL
ncbi:hypothetical protein [Polaribacter sp. M15]